jgi:hypothetical protein
MIYDYKCGQCGAVKLDVFNSISERRTNAPECCDDKMDIAIFTAPYGFVDNMEEYMCPITNVGITTRRQRNEMMAREGVVDANDMLKSRAFRDKQEAAVKAQREMIEAHRPKDLQDQVDGWAKKELDL